MQLYRQEGCLLLVGWLVFLRGACTHAGYGGPPLEVVFSGAYFVRPASLSMCL